MKVDCPADQFFRFGLSVGLECGHAEQVKAVGVDRIDGQSLAVDMLGLRQAAGLMKRQRVTDQGLQRRGGELSHPAILSSRDRRLRFGASAIQPRIARMLDASQATAGCIELRCKCSTMVATATGLQK